MVRASSPVWKPVAVTPASFSTDDLDTSSAKQSPKYPSPTSTATTWVVLAIYNMYGQYNRASLAYCNSVGHNSALVHATSLCSVGHNSQLDIRACQYPCFGIGHSSQLERVATSLGGRTAGVQESYLNLMSRRGFPQGSLPG